MALTINMKTGASVNGGPGVGLMTSAGNPWSVTDALALELVNRGVATPVNWTDDDLVPLSVAELARVRALVSGGGNPVARRALGGAFGAIEPVTRRNYSMVQNVLTTGAFTDRTYRQICQIKADTPFIVVVWGNDVAQGTVLQDITINASYDYAPANNVDVVGNLNSVPVYPFTFKGGSASSVTLSARKYIASDPIFGPFKAGDYFLVRSHVSVASAGMVWPVGLALNDSFEGESSGDKTATGNSGIAFAAAGPSFHAMGVFGVSGVGSVGLDGDSIQYGSGDGLGAAVRALDLAGIPWINVAMTGDTVGTAVGYLTTYGRTALISHAGNIITGYGRNDLNVGRTVAQIQSDLIARWKQFPRQRVWQQTIDPKTSSTDNWTTTTNQTVDATEPARSAVNTWLRSGAPMSAGAAVAVGTASALVAGQAGHPLYAACDTAARIEANAGNVPTVGGAFWLCNGSANYSSADGTHNSSGGAALKAPAITAQVVPYLLT